MTDIVQVTKDGTTSIVDVGYSVAAPSSVPVSGGNMSGTLTLNGSPPMQIPAGAAAGDVLTSDSAGNASWGPQNFAGLLTQTGVKTSAYTASPGDFVPVNTTSDAVTITLPNAPADLTVIGVKLVASATPVNAVTIARNGAGTDVFNIAGGATSLTLSLVGQSAVLQYQASGGIWLEQSGDLPASQLATRTVINVKEYPYSAVGNGSADDTPAIQAAINACPANGKVILPVSDTHSTYAISAPLQMYGASLSAPKSITLEGEGTPGGIGATIKLLSGFNGGNPGPAIMMNTQYAPGGVAGQWIGGELRNFYLDQTAAPNAYGIYYDRVQQVEENGVFIRAGACGRVIGWCAMMIFNAPVCYNASDAFWRWFRSYTTHAPWDTFNAGNTIGNSGTFTDSVSFKLNKPLNYISPGATAPLATAYFDILAGNDFQLMGGWSLTGSTHFVSNGINVDFSGGTQKSLYLFYAGHELDGVWDGTDTTGIGPPYKGAGAAISLNNAHMVRFSTYDWVGTFSAIAQAEMWVIKLTNCDDVVLPPGSHFSGRGILLDGTNTLIEVQGQFPQPYGDPVFTANATAIVDVSSNGAVLPSATISVNTLHGIWPTTGSFAVYAGTGSGPQIVSYTGYTTTSGVTTFTGCTGGTGTLATGATVVSGSIWQSSRFNVRYAGSLADSPATAAVMIAGSSTQAQSAATLLGNAITPALSIGRVMDSLAWQFMVSTSSTGTFLIRNPSAATVFQLTSSGQAILSSGVTGTYYQATGITGATATSRYVGATTSGAPASGTFILGDYTVDQTGSFWICTTAGTVGSGAVFTHLSSGVTLDTTSADIASVGIQAAGSSTKAAAADHVHGSARGGYGVMGSVAGWTYPYAYAQSTFAPTSGNAGFLLIFQVDVPVAATVSNVNMHVTTVGNTLANVYLALIDMSGNIQASSVDRGSGGTADSAIVSGGPNNAWTVPFQASYSAPAGLYYVGLLIGSASTQPTFAAARQSISAFVNIGVSAGSYRAAISPSGSLTSLPGSPITLSGYGSYAGAPWVALT